MEELRHRYILKQDLFGKKGQMCEILMTRGNCRNVTQVRFADGYSPVVARSAIRRATKAEIKEVDEKLRLESKLPASGKPTEGE
jgi:hypothetical protein